MVGHYQFELSTDMNIATMSIASLLEQKTGKTIEELMESGRLLRADGERYLPEGTKMKPSMNNAAISHDLYQLFHSIEHDGALFFDDVSSDNPMPCRLYARTNKDGKPELYMTDTLDEDELQEFAEDQMEDIPTAKESVPKPGFWNRVVDGVRRLFGMSGTKEMNEYRSKTEKAEKDYNENMEERSRWEKMPDKLRAQSKEIANLTVSERNKDKEMRAVENALRPEAMGVNKADAEFYEEFKETMLDMANNSFKVRNMLMHLGQEHELQGGKTVTSQLRQVYKAYVTERGNGRDLDLREMMNTATAEPEKVGNLDRILDNQKVVSGPTQAMPG